MTTSNTTLHSSYNSILDNETHYCAVDLLKHVDNNHLMKKLALSVANATDLPPSTVFLLGLGVFSSVACRKWRVNYQHSGSVPISLYIVAEQPSGTSKTRCLNTFQRPFQETHSKHIKKCNDEIKKIGKPSNDEEFEKLDALSKASRIPLFATNTTPEGLEKSLKFSEGFFSAVASEQGLFNSLLGLTYGNEGKANNNDLVLNGFNGDYINSMRITREGFSGFVAGGITLFAQGGSVETILQQSNGTGLAERFLMLSEKDNLGQRDWLKNKSIDKFLTDEYAKNCNNFAADVFMNPMPFNQLRELNINEDGWRMIYQYRNEIEPEIKPGRRFSHSSLRGAINKVDMQIMKIAANLHILKHSYLPPSTIHNDTVFSALRIVADMTEAHLMMLHDKEAVGAKAEFNAIIKNLGNKRKTQRDIINCMRNTQPFKDFTGNKAQAIKDTITEMQKHGLLIVDGSNATGTPYLKMAK